MRKPRFIARQGKHPHGILGHVVATVMAHETAADNDRAIALLEVEPEDAVLDVGTGHGRSLARLARQANRGSVVGVDDSDLMVGIARRRNRCAIASARVRIEKSSSHALPFPEATFDKALCVHTVYFWDPAEPHLREISRVLKPGGHLVLVFRPAEDRRVVARFPEDIYRFRTTGDMCELVEHAGLAVRDIERREKPGDSMVWLRAVRPARPGSLGQAPASPNAAEQAAPRA